MPGQPSDVHVRYKHRRHVRGSAPWHYVDVPLDEPRYDPRFSGDDPKKGLIVGKIAEFRAILKDPSRSVEERRFALRFIVHLVGDLRRIYYTEALPMRVRDKTRRIQTAAPRFAERGGDMKKL